MRFLVLLALVACAPAYVTPPAPVGVEAQRPAATTGITVHAFDEKGQPALLVTVVVTDAAGREVANEFTDRTGWLTLPLAAGAYQVLLIYGDLVGRAQVDVAAGTDTTLALLLDASTIEVVTIHCPGPLIDAGSTLLGRRFNAWDLRNLPWRDRSFRGVLDAVSGTLPP